MYISFCCIESQGQVYSRIISSRAIPHMMTIDALGFSTTKEEILPLINYLYAVGTLWDQGEMMTMKPVRVVKQHNYRVYLVLNMGHVQTSPR